MMGFDYCEEYLRSYQTKFYYGSLKKSHLQIDKKNQ